MRTQSGRHLDDSELAEIAARAEAGFELATWQPRRGRPKLDPLALAESPRITVRVPESVHKRIEAKATTEGRSVSEITRQALTAFALSGKKQWSYGAARRSDAASDPSRRPAWLRLLEANDALLAPVKSTGDAPMAWTGIVFLKAWRGGDSNRLSWAETYGKRNSVVADKNGQLSLAEIEVVKRLVDHGWEARWLDGFGRAPTQFREYTATLDELPNRVREALTEIDRQAHEFDIERSSAGRPDIVAWHDHKIAFLEVKGPNDRLQPAQVAWARAAVASEGISYGVVRWSTGPA
jgi:Arc/MetJ-type ribon-helix-helix transcriptional regulator